MDLRISDSRKGFFGEAEMTDGTNSRRGFLNATSKAVFGLVAGANAKTAVEAQPRLMSNETPRESTFDVSHFGATGDGRTLDTPAINKAIEAAAAAGGGTVYFRPGNYLCYSIHLKSKIRLQLASGVTIIAAEPPKSGQPGFDLPESNKPWEDYQDFGHNHWHNSLIWGEGLENVSICGPGLIWGKGLSRGEGPGPVAEVPGVANKAIGLKNCHDVLLRDFSILHGGHFGVLATGVDNLTIDNLKIDTNRDGIDVDCCRNVHISNCSVNSPWDDGICLKSSFALGYARDTEMVTITNCLLSGSFVEGALLDGTFKRYPADTDVDRCGRIKFGTETNGGFKNITITNCVFDGCFGLAILTVDGGVIEDVTISNITMRDVVGPPIFFRLGSRMRGPAGVPVGAIRRVNLSNIVSSSDTGEICSMVTGVPGHIIEDVKLANIMILHTGGGTKKDAAMQIGEKEKEYPEPNMFGTTPAFGLMIRHVKGIEVSDFKVITKKPDARPCFILDDVSQVDFFNIKAAPAQETATFVLNDVKSFNLVQCMPLPDMQIAETKHKEL